MMRKQQGTAILIAMTVLAFVTATTLLVVTLMRINLHLTQNVLTTDRLALYADSSLAWAREILIEDASSSTDARSQTWPVTMPRTSLGNNSGAISAVLEDAQVRFNLNSLYKADVKKAFVKLILAVQPGTKLEEAEGIANALAYWVSKYPNKDNISDEDYYSQQNPPYRAAHAPMLSLSELRLVRGITPALFDLLAPYCIALPVTITSNPSKAMSLISQAGDGAVIKEEQSAVNRPIDRYFLLTTQVYIGDQEMLVYTLLHRLNNQDKVDVKVVWQSRGTL